MKVVILCGGFGTRIRDVAEDIPKPMIPIGNRPILWHIMKYYACYGHKEFILCLGHKGEVIRNYFLNYAMNTNDCTITLGARDPVRFHNRHEEEDWKITLAETGLNSMTGARVRLIQKYVAGEEDFLLTYGDGVSNVDLDALVAFHKSHGRIMTVTGVKPPGRFGEMSGGADGTVTEFNEKPQATAGMISGGFFVCRGGLFDFLDEGEGLVFEQEPMRKLVKTKQMMVFTHDGFWQPMDTFRDYSLLNSLYAKGNAPWKIWD